MLLSEYIKRLQKIAREERKLNSDPEVVTRRYSDYTTDLGEPFVHRTSPESDCVPRVIELVSVNGGEYLREVHDSERTGAPLAYLRPGTVKRYVELVIGN